MATHEVINANVSCTWLKRSEKSLCMLLARGLDRYKSRNRWFISALEEKIVNRSAEGFISESNIIQTVW